MWLLIGIKSDSHGSFERDLNPASVDFASQVVVTSIISFT